MAKNAHINLFLLDDSEMNNRYLKIILGNASKVLKEVKMCIHTASNNLEFEREIKATDPHIVITDIHRPKGTNTELEELLKRRGLSPIKILYTGLDDQSFGPNPRYVATFEKANNHNRLTECLLEAIALIFEIEHAQINGNDSFHKVMAKVPDTTIEQGIQAIRCWLHA